MVSGAGAVAIAAVFIGGIVVISLVSRVSRTTELRADRIEFDEVARRFITDSLAHDGALHLAPTSDRPGTALSTPRRMPRSAA